MGPSTPSPETLSLIPQTVKQGMAIMLELRITLRPLGMGASLGVETGQMKDKTLSLKIVSTLYDNRGDGEEG